MVKFSIYYTEFLEATFYIAKAFTGVLCGLFCMRYFIPGYSHHNHVQYAAISFKNQKQATNSL